MVFLLINFVFLILLPFSLSTLNGFSAGFLDMFLLLIFLFSLFVFPLSLNQFRILSRIIQTIYVLNIKRKYDTYQLCGLFCLQLIIPQSCTI